MVSVAYKMIRRLLSKHEKLGKGSFSLVKLILSVVRKDE
jgi:hypothetical protein